MTTKSTKKAAHQRSIEPKGLPRKALLAVLDDRKTVTSFIQRRPYTMVALKSWYNGKEYDGIGFSKVCFPDGWDGEQGGDIAKSRALIDILHQIRWDEMTEYEESHTVPTLDECLDQGETVWEDIPF
jgi:hypothetical protein